MSLLRLLAAGKCFDGVGDAGSSRYHMRTPNLLPKFGSDKNPFLAKSKSNPAKAPAASVAKAAPTVSSPVSAKITAAAEVARPRPESAPTPPPAAVLPRKLAGKNPFAQPEPKKPAAPVNRERTIVPTPVVRKPLTPLPSRDRQKPGTFGWLKYLNPISYFSPAETRATRAARVWPSRTPVQGELSLDNVKVVRNDLNDADLEVVRQKRVSVPESMPMPAVAVTPVMVPAEKAAPSTWGMLKSRFARAEQQETQVH